MTIRQKQWQLHYLGYYGGEMDGIWGAQSKAAVVWFQKDNSLDADGVFGTQTIAKFMEIIKGIPKEIPDGKIAIDGLVGQETKDATTQPGTGPVLLGEVSRCNDDNTDNRFCPPMGRFPVIEEDEVPYRLLCNEYPAAK